MNIINKPRGKGKTTQLIYTSATTGYPIVCQNQGMVEQITRQADSIGCNIPLPITVAEIRRNQHKYHYDNVLVDEVMFFLHAALNEYLGANVVACTMSIDDNGETYAK